MTHLNDEARGRFICLTALIRYDKILEVLLWKIDFIMTICCRLRRMGVICQEKQEIKAKAEYII